MTCIFCDNAEYMIGYYNYHLEAWCMEICALGMVPQASLPPLTVQKPSGDILLTA